VNGLNRRGRSLCATASAQSATLTGGVVATACRRKQQRSTSTTALISRSRSSQGCGAGMGEAGQRSETEGPDAGCQRDEPSGARPERQRGAGRAGRGWDVRGADGDPTTTSVMSSRRSLPSVAALAALVPTDPVLVWDPEGRSLIVANIVGEMRRGPSATADRGLAARAGKRPRERRRQAAGDQIGAEVRSPRSSPRVGGQQPLGCGGFVVVERLGSAPPRRHGVQRAPCAVCAA
jgi:hypothetical protein